MRHVDQVRVQISSIIDPPWYVGPLLLRVALIALRRCHARLVFQIRFGDPFLFATVEASKGWDQGAGPHTWLKFELLETIEHHPFAPSTLNLVAQGLLVLGGLALVPWVTRRFGWAYALYVLGVCGMALVGTKDFMGSGRYLVSAFPLFAVLGDLLAGRRGLRAVLVPASLVGLLAMAVLFGRGSYLS